jgi:copper transport protein
LAVRLLLLGVLPALLVGAVGPLAAGRRRIPAFVCGTVIAAGLGATWAAASHAATGAHGGTALVADVAHLLAASVWVGGLATALTLLPFTEVAGTAVHRFSRLAMVCVGVLVVTGLFQAWLRVQTPAAVLTTTYGRLLAAKIAVLVTVLTVAYLARVRLRRADRSGLRLGRLLAAETAGVAVVLALTAVLVQSPPAAQAYAARPVTRSARFHSGRDAGLFTVRLPNAARGVDGGHVIIRSEDGRLRDVLEMKASWTQLRLGIGPLPVRFSRTGPGHYQASWPSLPVPGTWRLALTIRTTDIDETTVRTQLAIH